MILIINPNISLSDNKYFDDFCNILLNDVKFRMKNSIKYYKYPIRKDLLSNRYIDWTNKPKIINMYSVPNIILNNLILCKSINNEVCIRVDNNKLFPYTRNTIDQVSRLFEYGSESHKPLPFITPVFRYYTDNMNEFWESFITNKTREVIINNERIPI